MLYSRGVGVLMEYTENVSFSDMDVSSHGRNCMSLKSANLTAVTRVRCLYAVRTRVPEEA